jgi:transposase-like protein
MADKFAKCGELLTTKTILEFDDAVEDCECREYFSRTYICPYCSSDIGKKNGHRNAKTGPIQRYFCNSCRGQWSDGPGVESIIGSEEMKEIIQMRSEGLSFRQIAKAIKEHYKVSLHHTTVFRAYKRKATI